MAQLSSPTLTQLLLEARIFLNEPSAQNSFWSDQELTMYANDAVRLYFQEVVERVEGQFDAVAELDLVEGEEAVALPSDCFYVKALYKKGSNQNDMLVYRNNLTDSYVTNTQGSPNNFSPFYYFRGNSLVFRPIPAFSEAKSLILEYTQFPETMITGGDHLSSGISPIFKEVIVMYMVYKAKVKEDLVNGGGTSERAAGHLSAVVGKFVESLGLRSKNPTFTKPYNP